MHVMNDEYYLIIFQARKSLHRTDDVFKIVTTLMYGKESDPNSTKMSHVFEKKVRQF
jgi:hypothetical protein